MKKKQNIPSAFEDALNDLGIGSVEGGGDVTNMDVQDTFVDVEPPTNLDPDPAKETEEEKKPAEDNPTAGNDNSDIPQDVLDRMNGQEDNKPNETNDTDNNVDEIGDDDITEAQQVGALFDAVAEKFGWDLNEIKEDERPLTVEDLTNYLRDVVDQNSVPEYADERIQALDQYVKQGGRFEDFYTAQKQQLDYDNINLEDENNQRTVIRDLLRASGYTEDQINTKIDRYESADMLEEEAEDALSRLKVIKQQETEMLQRQQEAARKQQEEETRNFYNTVSADINNLTNIRGINIPKEDRKQLFEYIFKQDANGLTQYQKDFNKNLSKNLIESAYFTMKADSFITEAKKTGETTAAQKLRQMLRHKSKNHSTFNADEEKQKSALEIASMFQ